MNVIFFSQYYTPETFSSPYLTTDLLEAMSNAGWHVDFYTPTPSRGIDNETRKQYGKIRREVAFDGNVIIHRMPLYKETGNSITRALRSVIFNIQTLFIGLFKKADIVFSMSNPPTQGAVLGLISKLCKKKKTVYNVQDVFPENLLKLGMTEKDSLVWKVGTVLKKFAYGNCDRFIVISRDIKDSLTADGVLPEKVDVVYNWTDSTAFPVPKRDNKLYEELNISRNKFIVTYAGNLGNAQYNESMFEAAKLLKDDEDILFVIIGNGVRENDSKKYVADNDITNVLFFPLMQQERISEVYSFGDVSVVSCRQGVSKCSCPSKTGNIMTAGTPVLLAFDEDSELFSIIRDKELGMSVPTGDARLFADAVGYMKANPEKCESFGKNGIKYAKEFLSKKLSTDMYIRILSDTVSRT